MGDLIDSLFKRQCSLHGVDDRECLGQDAEITVVEVGRQSTVDTYRCSDFKELTHSFGQQTIDDSDNEDPFWEQPRRRRPRSLKLFFLFPPRDDQESASPFAKTLPRICDILQEQIGFRPITSVKAHDVEDDSLSPTSSPHKSALTTRSRRPRFSLGPVEEEKVIELQPQQGPSQQGWTWETRFTRSTTLTLAGPDSMTYFCMNYPEKLQRRISDSVHSMGALAKNPLFMDTLIIDEIIAFYRDAIKSHRSQLLAINDDDCTGTEMSIKLEELATHWRTIIRDIHNLQTHINHLQELAATNIEQDRSKTPSLYKHDNYHQHTRQKSSEVLGPQAAEIFKLQNSTCEFWARCVNMYLERTTDRIRNSTYRLRKTIPLRRRGSLPEINRRLSNFTIEVAVQFQRNSASVSTLAFSFFSTIFFSPDGLLFAITYWWWIIATLIVPLTLIVIHLWFETLANNLNTPFLRRRKTQPQQLDGIGEEGMD